MTTHEKKPDFNAYVQQILRSSVYDIAVETSLDFAPKLSRVLGNTVLIKREDTQPIFSFKCRGAYNKIHALSEQQRTQGVVAVSAGNHAQGVALAAQKLNISAKIVMPITTPSIKSDAVKDLKATVISYGDNFEEAFLKAQQIAEQEQRILIPPFDDELVISGQGTIAMEILRQSKEGFPDMIFIPVGGGGLIAGIAAFIKEIAPEIKIIGVEPEDSACLTRSIEANKRITLKHVGLFADGVAVRQVGKKNWDILQHKGVVDDIITVTTDEICAAIKDSFEATRTVTEPSGSLALAGLKKKVQRDGIKNKKLVTIQSGANLNFSRLQHVVERSEAGENREILLAVTIPEKPGSFLQFCRILGKTSISEFNYRYFDENTAHIFVGMHLSAKKNKQNLIDELAKNNYSITDLSQDELSKNHIRHMVGGRTTKATNECLYRFTFPERPGALLDFLSLISHQWNISLFHYRNHGAAYGRVLVGLEIPPNEKQEFETLINNWDKTAVEETNNPSYRLFLSTL
jgi:threonine dehydratase